MLLYSDSLLLLRVFKIDDFKGIFYWLKKNLIWVFVLEAFFFKDVSVWLVFISLLYLNTEAAWLLYAVFNAVVAAAQVLSCVQLFATPWIVDGSIDYIFIVYKGFHIPDIALSFQLSAREVRWDYYKTLALPCTLCDSGEISSPVWESVSLHLPPCWRSLCYFYLDFCNLAGRNTFRNLHSYRSSYKIQSGKNCSVPNCCCSSIIFPKVFPIVLVLPFGGHRRAHLVN